MLRFRLAVEFRAGAWLGEEMRETTLHFLRQHELTLVCVDEPQEFKSSLPLVADVTAPLGFIRFHGRNSKNWERHGIPSEEKYSYLYDVSELQGWIPKIRHMADMTTDLHIIFKNKSGDFPVRNVRQLRQMLGEG